MISRFVGKEVARSRRLLERLKSFVSSLILRANWNSFIVGPEFSLKPRPCHPAPIPKSLLAQIHLYLSSEHVGRANCALLYKHMYIYVYIYMFMYVPADTCSCSCCRGFFWLCLAALLFPHSFCCLSVALTCCYICLTFAVLCLPARLELAARFISEQFCCCCRMLPTINRCCNYICTMRERGHILIQCLLANKRNGM